MEFQLMETPEAHASSEVQVPTRDGMRAIKDRRRRPTPRFSRFSFYGGRRRSIRRASEKEGAYVDRYGFWSVFAVCWVALMNLGDSVFTLIHLQSGGVEVNPVADKLLQTGQTGFVLFKSVLVAVALLVLVLHKNFRMARFGLWVAAVAYTALNVYHLSLFE